MKTNKAMAIFFYEQCAGSFSGHMSSIPNNPTLFGIIKAHTKDNNSMNAASKKEFSEFLMSIAENLLRENNE